MMFSYLALGSNDIARAKAFYDPVLASLGLHRAYADAAEIGYATAPDGPCEFWVNRPFDGKPASVGNGSMPCFAAPTRAAVDAFHAAALANGGSDEGAPGLRPYGPYFYAAYVRDPDGNKLSAVCDTPE